MDLLPDPIQLIAAWLIFAGLVFGAVTLTLWSIRWIRDYRDEKKSALDTK